MASGMVAWLVTLETGGVSERLKVAAVLMPMVHTALEECGTASDGVCRTLRCRRGDGRHGVAAEGGLPWTQ